MTKLIEVWDKYHFGDACGDEMDAAVKEAEAEIERLRAALEPFAKLAPTYDPPEDDDDDLCWYHRACPTLGDLRRARAALEALK